MRAILERFPAETLAPGDVLITNDPWICAGHLFDVAIVTPVFRDGRVVAILGTIGHVTDIGGTRDSLSAREIYEEGFQIPPMKLYRAGAPNEDLFRLLAENVRKSEQVLGDLHALISANASGAQRLLAFMAEYGLEDLEALATVDPGPLGARDARRHPPGAGRHLPERDLERRAGHAAPLPGHGDRRGRRIGVDFAGAPPQQPRGGSNCTYNYTAAHTVLPAQVHPVPGVPSNAGCYRPFTRDRARRQHPQLRASRPRSTCAPARAGTSRRTSSWPWRGCAPGPGAGVHRPPGLHHASTARDRTGRFYSDHLFQGGGQGASAQGDGKSALLWPTSAANTSVELFETRTPMLVLEKRYLPDSGGPGRQRGGLGQVVRVRKLADDGRPAYAGLFPDGVLTRAAGLFGGRSGGAVRGVLLDGTGAVVADYGVGSLVTLERPEQILELRLAGGAGFGDPRERPLELIQHDLDDGYVTLDSVTIDYGCRVAPEGRVTRGTRSGNDTQ